MAPPSVSVTLRGPFNLDGKWEVRRWTCNDGGEDGEFVLLKRTVDAEVYDPEEPRGGGEVDDDASIDSNENDIAAGPDKSGGLACHKLDHEDESEHGIPARATNVPGTVDYSNNHNEDRQNGEDNGEQSITTGDDDNNSLYHLTPDLRPANHPDDVTIAALPDIVNENAGSTAGDFGAEGDDEYAYEKDANKTSKGPGSEDEGGSVVSEKTADDQEMSDVEDKQSQSGPSAPEARRRPRHEYTQEPPPLVIECDILSSSVLHVKRESKPPERAGSMAPPAPGASKPKTASKKATGQSTIRRGSTFPNIGKSTAEIAADEAAKALGGEGSFPEQDPKRKAADQTTEEEEGEGEEESDPEDANESPKKKQRRATEPVKATKPAKGTGRGGRGAKRGGGGRGRGAGK